MGICTHDFEINCVSDQINLVITPIRTLSVALVNTVLFWKLVPVMIRNDADSAVIILIVVHSQIIVPKTFNTRATILAFV